MDLVVSNKGKKKTYYCSNDVSFFIKAVFNTQVFHKFLFSGHKNCLCCLAPKARSPHIYFHPSHSIKRRLQRRKCVVIVSRECEIILHVRIRAFHLEMGLGIQCMCFPVLGYVTIWILNFIGSANHCEKKKILLSMMWIDFDWVTNFNMQITLRDFYHAKKNLLRRRR